MFLSVYDGEITVMDGVRWMCLHDTAFVSELLLFSAVRRTRRTQIETEREQEGTLQ